MLLCLLWGLGSTEAPTQVGALRPRPRGAAPEPLRAHPLQAHPGQVLKAQAFGPALCGRCLRRRLPTVPHFRLGWKASGYLLWAAVFWAWPGLWPACCLHFPVPSCHLGGWAGMHLRTRCLEAFPHLQLQGPPRALRGP